MKKQWIWVKEKYVSDHRDTREHKVTASIEIIPETDYFKIFLQVALVSTRVRMKKTKVDLVHFILLA